MASHSRRYSKTSAAWPLFLLGLFFLACSPKVTEKGPTYPAAHPETTPLELRPGAAPGTASAMSVGTKSNQPACVFRRLEFLGCGKEGLSAIHSYKEWVKYQKGKRCGKIPELPQGFDFDKEMILIVSGCRPAHERVMIREAKERNGKLLVTTVTEAGGTPPSDLKPICQSDAVALCPSKLPLEEQTFRIDRP